MSCLRPLAALVAAAALAMLVACTAGPDYKLPASSDFAKVEERPPALDPRSSGAVDPAKAAVEGPWWRLYEDPQLNALIEQSLTDSTELRIATARLQQAQAAYVQIAAAGGLHGGADLAVVKGRISAESLLQTEPLPLFNLINTNAAVSYELDLSGRVRRAAEAAHAGAEATQAARDLARISVAASVADAYLEICHSNHELAVARQSLSIQQHSRDITARLLAVGRGTPTAVERAESQVSMLEAALPPLVARRQAAGYALAELLGRTPGQVPAEALTCEEAPSLSQAVPLGDGAALLRRRPDVRHAERELAAATAGIGVATAELYPDVRLGASFGLFGLLKDAGKLATQDWLIGPLISWSVPDREAHARIAVARAGAAVALAEFDHTVLGALRETQTVLSSYAEDLRREDALRRARDHARTAAADLRHLYESGREPYLSSLDGERTLATAESALAGAEAQLSQDQIRLFLALGGGWQSPQVADVHMPSATPEH